MKGKKKQIYISEQDYDVLEYLENQPNQSQYVVRLIKADMEKQQNWKEEVRKMIEEYLSKAKDNPVDSSIRTSIDSLLNL